MIGRLTTTTGEPVATLADDGKWQAADGADDGHVAVAAYLAAAFDPLKRRAVGDGRLPFGVAAMNRAAMDLGLLVRLARPIHPLPAGAVS